MKKKQINLYWFLLIILPVVWITFSFCLDYYKKIQKDSDLKKKVARQYYSKENEEGGGERYVAIHKLFRLACELYHENQLIPVEVSVQDRGSEDLGVYTFCYPEDRPELAPFSGPDWCFYWWKSANIHNYLATSMLLETIGKTPASTEKAGWVGNVKSPLSDVPEFKTRPLLKEMAEKNPSLLEVIHVAPIDGQINENNQDYLTLEEQISRYKYLIDIGGNGYSGRLKMILWSGRPVLLVQRRYIEYFYKDLIPYEHYIPVKEDLSDLLQQIEWCRSHPQKASTIGKNALTFARHHFALEKILENVFKVMVSCRDYQSTKKT